MAKSTKEVMTELARGPHLSLDVIQLPDAVVRRGRGGWDGTARHRERLRAGGLDAGLAGPSRVVNCAPKALAEPLAKLLLGARHRLRKALEVGRVNTGRSRSSVSLFG